MDRKDRDRLETFRRKLLGSADVPAASAGGIPIDGGWDVDTLVVAQGKLVAMVAMVAMAAMAATLLDRERILKASELARCSPPSRASRPGGTPVEGEILAIRAAGARDVASGL